MDKIYILEDRGILFIDGIDVKDFLQNIITNNIDKVTENSSCFASLLSPQGKFLFDFIIIKHKNGYFIDCEKTQIDELFKQLSLYKLRSNVQILNLSNEFVLVALSYKKFLSIDKSKDELGYTLKYGEDPILLDPRNKNLGARLIINLEKLNLSLEKLELKSLNPSIKKAIDFSCKRIFKYHSLQKIKNIYFKDKLNNSLGYKTVSINKVGIYVPANLPSTLLMTAIPAKIAGVKKIILANPRLKKN